MIVLDANILIAFFTSGHAYAERAFDVIDTEEELALHPITLAEILTKPVHDGNEREVLSQLLDVGIQRWSPDLDEPLRLARLRAQSRLRMPDCCVLSAALASGSSLATFDKALAEASRATGVDVVGLGAG